MAQGNDRLIDMVLKNTNIIDVIGEVTSLEKKGKGHMGLCPFHEEKTPSFSVSEEKQVYHCFSCKKSGNALTFIKETKGLQTGDAIKHLAARINMDISNHYKPDPLKKYYDINAEADQFFHVYLNHTKSGRVALDYLIARGIDTELIETFHIGLAPEKKDALYQALKKKDFLASDLLDQGLIHDSENPTDVFRNRIMFPLHDASGNVVGFSGRIFKDGVKTAKYINSTKTKTFEKNRILYNMHRARIPIRDKGRAVLFEGFMDVIAAHSAGVKEGVAVMGTALSDEHIRQIREQTSTVILCFDGDSAGVTATKGMIDTLRPSSLTVKVARMPEKKDPDDYIRENGKEAFLNLIDDALSDNEFLYEHYRLETKLEKITDIERFKKKVFTLIKNLSNVEQNYFLTKLADDLKIHYDTIAGDFKSIRQSALPKYRQLEPIKVTDKFHRAERAIIHYFFKDEHYPRKLNYEFGEDTFIPYAEKEARDIQHAVYDYYREYPQSCILIDLFAQTRLTDRQKKYLNTHIDCDSYPYQDAEFEDLIGVLRRKSKNEQIEHLRKRLKDTEDIDKKINLKKEIDAITKEVKHGKRKNHQRTHRT